MKKLIDKFKNLASTWALAVFFLLALGVGLAPSPQQSPEKPRQPVPVTDMTGRTVRMDVPAEKVFILTPILWHYLTVSLTDEPVVKVPPYMTGEFGQSVLGDMFPDLKNKDLAFTDFSGPAPISVEELLQSRPDAALVWNYMSAAPDLVNLQSLLKIAADGGDKTRLYKMLGEMTGRKDRVARLFERFAEERDRVAADVSPCPARKSAVVIGTNGFSLWGRPSQRFFMDNLEMICGRNAAEGLPVQGGNLNLENLLVLDPDVVWLNPYVLEQTDLRVRDFYEDPRFKGLAAVKNRRVYHMPLGASRLEGPVEVPLSMLWQRLILFPEIPSGLNLRDEIRRTYLETYGHEMSEPEIDRWLRLEENFLSAHYASLFGASLKENVLD
jgi:iron complex transport system substrate-binding protein